MRKCLMVICLILACERETKRVLTNHHLIGVQLLYPFWVSLMRKTLPTLPLLSGSLFIATEPLLSDFLIFISVM